MTNLTDLNEYIKDNVLDVTKILYKLSHKEYESMSEIYDDLQKVGID